MRLRQGTKIRKVGAFGLPYKWMFLLIALFAVLPAVQAAAADLSSGQSEQALFASLQAGQRIDVEREYETPERPTVYLTFDDGPSDNTPDVLDILREEQVPATFFVLGQNVKTHRQLVQQIVKEGHAIGNHTYDHVYDKLYGSFGEFWRQVQATEAELDKVGVRTHLIRAPGGTYTNFDAAYFYLLERAGYAIHDWNVDSGDSKRRGVPAKEIIEGATNLATTKKTPNEIVVLMHDGSGHSETVKALPSIIRFYKDRGYTFATLSPDVNPIQSPLGKLKWKRGYTLSDFGDWLAASAEHAALYAQEKPEGASADDATPPAVTKPPEPPLTLHFSGNELTLGETEYWMSDGKLYVPLRDLVESMGGTVEWREQSRVAVARYGLSEVAFDLPGRAIDTSAPGKPDERITLADIRLIDSKLVVPLRTAVELLGGEIADYSFQAERRDVSISSGPGNPLALAPHSPISAIREAAVPGNSGQSLKK